MFVKPAGNDGLLGYVNNADDGQDDNFHLQSSSPAIDEGNPNSYWLSEPIPSGGRVNLGYDGGTSAAAVSASQTLQVVSPDGPAKLLAGQTYTINWRSSGLLKTNTVALINAGGGTIDGGTSGVWLGNQFLTSAPNTTNTGSFTTAVDTSGVTNPAPQGVYQNYIYANGSYGSSNDSLSWSLPVPNGTYTIRLHFADPYATAANQRVFDVQLQGATVKSGYDIYAAAGAADKATTLSYTVTASGGTGINLSLVGDASNQNWGPLISGIELSAANAAGGVTSPKVNLQYSGNGGSSWSTIASNLTMDRFGRGSYAWTIPTAIASGNYLIRVVSTDYPTISGTSLTPLQIAAASHSYYVNDNSTLGDQYTTAVGNNANDGKTPATPMASLAALISAYHPGAGDTIYVDTGVYNFSSNFILTAQDSGVHIVGATISASESAAYKSSVLSSSPLAYYRLGDASGTTAADASGHNLKGTYSSSGVTLGKAGVLPTDPTTAAAFDGSGGSVALPSGFANLTGGFSFDAWIYPTSSADNQQIFQLSNGNGQSAGSSDLHLSYYGDTYYYGNTLYLTLYQDGSNHQISVGNALTLNTWQHVAFTIDASGNAVMYVNGLAVAGGAMAPLDNLPRHPEQPGLGNRRDSLRRGDAGGGVVRFGPLGHAAARPLRHRHRQGNAAGPGQRLGGQLRH